MEKNQSFKAPRNVNDLTSSLSAVIFKQKVLVLIDAANLFFSTSVTKIHIDFKQMYNWFSKKCNLVDVMYYTAFDPDDVKQMAFLQDLEKSGYKLIQKPIKVYSSMIKGNMDIELAVDAMNLEKQYDILALFSGDGDFTYLIQDLEKKGKRTIVIATGGFTSYELHQQAHNYFFLNRISSIWRTPRKTSQSDGVDSQNLLPKILPPDVVLDKQTKVTPKTKLPRKNPVREVPQVFID